MIHAANKASTVDVHAVRAPPRELAILEGFRLVEFDGELVHFFLYNDNLGAMITAIVLETAVHGI